MTFTHPHRVRYLEVDAQGVVFNGHYLGWFDDAMTAFLDHRGLPYAAMLESGHDVQLVRSESGVRQKARRRIVRPGLRGGSKASHRQNQHEAGEETTKGEGKKRFKVLDNSIERAAQMIAGNTASASLGSSNGESDERLQRLEDRFSSLESKIDRLLARSLNPARSSLSAGPAGSPTKAPAAAGAPAFSFTGAPAFSFASLLTPKGKSDTNLEA